MCFENSFASHEKAQYWSSKNTDKPRYVFKCTGKKFLFDCPTCNHEIIQDPSHISNGRWCPYCCIPQKKLCGKKECNDCFKKSFASHEKALYWSKKNKEQSGFVLKKGDKRIWFNCDKCNHNFDSQIKNITLGGWCPYCSNQKICKEDNCHNCFEKSFASHKKAQYWSNENKIKPRQVLMNSGKKYKFNCDKCYHTFHKRIAAITCNQASWCPHCTNKKMCKEDNCNVCFSKSFASHSKVKYWSKKNTTNPDTFSKETVITIGLIVIYVVLILKLDYIM